MNNEKQLQDFKREVEKLREIDGAEEYAKQLAHLFLGNGLSLKTILLMAIDFGQQRPQWITVKEELPKENERIIAYNGVFNEIHLCDFHDGIFEDFYGPFNGTITHWMPLPTPPQRKEE